MRNTITRIFTTGLTIALLTLIAGCSPSKESAAELPAWSTLSPIDVPQGIAQVAQSALNVNNSKPLQIIEFERFDDFFILVGVLPPHTAILLTGKQDPSAPAPDAWKQMSFLSAGWFPSPVSEYTPVQPTKFATGGYPFRQVPPGEPYQSAFAWGEDLQLSHSYLVAVYLIARQIQLPPGTGKPLSDHVTVINQPYGRLAVGRYPAGSVIVIALSASSNDENTLKIIESIDWNILQLDLKVLPG